MPVNSPHPDYERHIAVWQRCRDAAAGEDAIKEAGDAYLPRLSAHTDGTLGEAAYQRYKARASWFAATGRTIQGYVGAIMRNDPGFKVPEIINARIKNVTGDGQSATELVHTIVEELVTTARLGLLVDCREGELPFVKIYDPEAIINWKVVNGKVTLVVLQETVLVDGDDEFAQKEEVHYRVMRLDPVEGYVQEIYTPAATGKLDYTVAKTVQPTFRTAKLAEIPFYFVSTNRDQFSISRPPLLGLIGANIAHYQLDADLRHGMHFTALPTAVFSGVNSEDTFHLGSETAIKLHAPDAKATYLEFNGTGLATIKEAKNELKSQMASLGAQLLQRGERGRGVETAEAARIQHSGETSLLSVIVTRAEEAMKRALLFMAQWSGALSATLEDIEVNINRDFIDATLTAADITALTASYQSGALDLDSLYWNFVRGGVVDPKTTREEYVKAIEEAAAKKQLLAVETAQRIAEAKPQTPDGNAGGNGQGNGGTGQGNGPSGSANKEQNGGGE